MTIVYDIRQEQLAGQKRRGKPLGNRWVALGCCPFELYGQADVFHDAPIYAGNYPRHAVSSEFWADNGRFFMDLRHYEPNIGYFADKFNRKWIIVGSLLVGAVVDYALGFAGTYQQIFALRSIMGVSEALYIPAGLSLIADYHGPNSKSFAIALHMTGIYTGQALGGFGATFAQAFSWQAAFHSFGLLGMGYAVILMLFLKEKPNRGVKGGDSIANSENKVNVRSSFSKLFSNHSFWLLLFYFALPSLPGWAIKSWLPTLFSTNLHIPMSQAAPMATVTIAIASFVGVLIGGKTSDVWVQKNLRGRIYIGATGLFLMIPSLILLGFGHSLLSFLTAAACFGVGFGLFDANNMPILCQFVPKKNRATAYGLMNMTGVSAGAFITNLLGKSTDSGHLGSGFAMLSVVVALLLVVALIFLRPKAVDCIEY